MPHADAIAPRALATGGPPATVFVMGLLAIMWLAVALTGERPDAALLLRFGGNAVHEVQQGEAWRLLTATLLHAGLGHLLGNLVALYLVGPALEGLLGRIGFLVVYACSAIAGSAGSLHILGPYSVGVGASGAILGVSSALVVAWLRAPGPLRSTSRWAAGRAVLSIVLTLYGGWRQPGVDGAAHMVGVLAGLIMGALLPLGLTSFRGAGAVRPLAIAGVLAAAVVLSVRAVPPVPIGLRQVLSSQQRLEQGRQELERACLSLARLKYGDGRYLAGWQLSQRILETELPQARSAVALLDQVRLPANHSRSQQARLWMQQGRDMVQMLQRAPSVQDARRDPFDTRPAMALTWALAVGCTPPPRQAG